MILKFPDLDTLKLALTSGAVPPAVSVSGATAGLDEQNQVWVETSASLPKAALAELKRLGVQSAKTNGAALTAAVGSWLEVLPLLPDPTLPAKLEQTAVLFDVSGEELPGFVNEILRLGNDRQSFRWLEPGDDKKGRALLRVFGPPYYSLLRALDRQGKQSAPLAYLETVAGSRVWTELGHVHPLADRIKAPEGKLLLLQPPCQWTVLDDVPFREVYEVLEFKLPASPARYRDGKLDGRIRVSLSLRPGGAPEGAELWVLRDNAVEKLNRFVQDAEDQLLNRLRFAVAQREGQEIVVLRIAHSKLPPPVLVLPIRPEDQYRPFQKLPNLFLPCGQRLHPPLRKDQMRKLLADDPALVTWLSPGVDHTFTPESLPENSFRPLFEWVDYVLDRDKAALDAWVQASRFDFEAFVCDEDGQPKQKKPPPPPEKVRRAGAKQSGDKNRAAAVTALRDLEANEANEIPLEEEVLDAAPVEPNEIQLRLRALEEEFLAFEGGLDVPEREKLWPELARLNAALGTLDDAGVCWTNALWPREPASVDHAARWFRTEASGVSSHAGRSWVARSLKNGEISGDELDRLLAIEEPATADVRALAALLVWSARRTPSPAALLERLNPVGRFLEKNERLLPIRAAWLAWYHFARLSGDDVLALAQARDRLLERLFQNGLRPEQDLPSFLRFSGQASNQRFRVVRQWLGELPDAAKAWSAKGSSAGSAATEPTFAYIDLIFAFGLARLGENDAARALLQQATTALSRKDAVHTFLQRAFEYRIRQALDARSHGGAQPNEPMEELDRLDKLQRYVVERLLERSRILEPNRSIDAYRHWTLRDDPLGKELAELVDLRDRKEVEARARKLLSEIPKGTRGNDLRSRILRVALDQAPRIGEEFGRDVLAKVAPAFDALADSSDAQVLLNQANLLEKGLAVAAHFDRSEHIHPLVDRFRTMLAAQKGDAGIQTIESLAAQCFRGLRKLGMREEIDVLLTQMALVLLGGQDPRTLDAANLPTQPASLRALLHVAGGWYYFGRDRQADPVMQKVRGVLFGKDSGLLPKDLSQLACTYAATIGQAPVEMARKRLEELFGKLPPIKDALTTRSHYFLLHLNVVEAVVLAVVSDDFTMGTNARRWLDDDEYLVRKRIHRDLRALKEHS